MIVPDLSQEWSKDFTAFLLSELPDDDEANDLVIETIVGTEIYKHMKYCNNNDVKRRILLSKWLYSKDFLTHHCFPINHRELEQELD